ncbi:GAF domain-containing sensor histidine kinase [Luteolibacter flavescens]|uniref:histidine kinase n=1 Tax=Luteolibacter flavescens TaxID=1859460 RepID=A0ABT3FJ45_9BACT|nr:GAF domain-containing sensor histidine kinase [Luteolibacter flavescens]MCW1883593.1 GAF domain-containing sensor histidine kinase [Luteolibacter flavescens]
MRFGPTDANRERLESLKASGLLGDSHGIDFDKVTELAAKATGVPISLVSLVDRDRQVFAGASGLSGDLASSRQTPIHYSFCQHTVNLRQPLVISDARKNALVSKNPAIEEFGVRAYLGFPVLGAGQHLYGAVCAVDTEVRQWGDDEIEIVRGFTSIVSSMIEQHLAREYQKLLTDVLLHDLNGPLGRIRKAADVFAARAGELPKPLDTLALSLKGNADQASAMIAALLGRSTKPTKCDDLQGTVEAAVRLMRPRAEERGIQIRVDAPGDPIALDLPHRVLMQVLDNLISNSVRFSNVGEVRIRIKQVGEAAIIDVEDDGPGFQADDYPKIFQRYATLSAKPPGGETSAGLGLSIVKSLLENEGATIVLLSHPGESAAFRITVPLRRQA